MKVDKYTEIRMKNLQYKMFLLNKGQQYVRMGLQTFTIQNVSIKFLL